MAQDFLSQEEVDALLKGVTGEPEEIREPTEETGGVRPCDLVTQQRAIDGRMPTLELINDRFARNFRIGLFEFMQRNVEISAGPLKVQKYGEFVRNLALPANLNLVQAKPLRGTALVVFDPNLIFLVVDNMFGGDGRFHSRSDGREFSPTEQRIIRSLLKVVFAEYEKAWQPVFPLHFEYLRSETSPQFANIAAANETAVSFAFSLELNGSATEMQVCMPYSMIEPIRETLNKAAQSERASADMRWATLLASQVQDAEVELRARFGSAAITLRQILAMKVGDVVPVTIDELAQAEICDVPVMECRYGVQGGKYALRVERFVAQTEAAPGAPPH
jgi:flagellar motor switch protein FliM